MTRRARRALIATIASVNLVIGGYGGYGLSTRAGAPTFSRGGAFGARDEASGTPGAARAGQRNGRTNSPIAGKANAGRTEVKGARVARAGTTSARIATPREGTYRYTSTGHEQVHFGFASACSWDLDGSRVAVKHDDDDVVFDWTYREGRREERHIDDYRASGIYAVLVGAAVTCGGVRKTTEDHYDPPALRIPSPLRVDRRWTVNADAGSRREHVVGSVTAHRAIKVGAGRFDAFQIKVDVSISGGQEGTHKTTFWFAPSLGMIVKQVADTDIRDGQAHFESHIELALAALPTS